VAGTPFADSDATARVRRILQDAAEALTGVVQDLAPCPACKGTERVQTPEPCCPEDGTPLRGDLLGTCPACGRSVRAGIPGWLPAPSPVGLARRELAGAIDAADPDQPVVVVSDGEAGLLPAAEQVEILQIAALLVTLPPVQQPQPLTASLAAFVERLIAHLVVPAGGPRLLPLSAEEKQLLAAVHLLVSARSELESRRVLICVGCGRTRPDDRDARLRRRDEQRRRVLLASVASAALTSLLTANPVSLLMVVRSLVASPAGAIGTSCPGCADQTAVSVRVPVCPHCLAAVRLPTARQCRCGHRFRLTAQPPRLFGPAGEQGIWTEFAASTAAAPRSAVIERRRPLPAGEPLIRSVDGTVGLDGDHVVLRNCLGEARVPLASLRDVDVTEPGGDGTGWLRLRTVPDGAERQRRDLPPHRDPFALLFDRAQADAARSVQRTIGTLVPTGAGCSPPHAA
jgi:hypothetical protein